jgi:hypothetical protein
MRDSATGYLPFAPAADPVLFALEDYKEEAEEEIVPSL